MIGLCFTGDILTFDQNWHYLYSNFVGGKDLSSDSVVILKWLGHLSLKYAQECSQIWVKYSEQNFPLVYSATQGQGLPISMMLRNTSWTGSKPSRRSNTAAKRKENEEKETEKKNQNSDFFARPSQNVVKRNSSGKKGKLSCCKCIFDQIKANLAEIQPQNHQNVQKTHFWQKAPGVNGLSRICIEGVLW